MDHMIDSRISTKSAPHDHVVMSVTVHRISVMREQSLTGGETYEMEMVPNGSETDAFLSSPDEEANTLAATRIQVTKNTLASFAQSPDVVICILSLAIVVMLSIFFYVPSTIFVYIVGVSFALPLFLFLDVFRMIQRKRFPARFSSRVRLLVSIFATMYTIICLVAHLFGQAYTNPRAPPAIPKHKDYNPRNQTYYIASNLYNSEAILPQYTKALLQFIQDVGPKNVFVSIYENNSKDQTPRMLRELDAEMQRYGVRRNIRTDVKNKEFQEKERIDRLAHIRNEAMAPMLRDAPSGLDHRTFSKVIFVNDVILDAGVSITYSESIHTLLNTADGNFDQVCGIDYYPIGFHDTYAFCLP